MLGKVLLGCGIAASLLGVGVLAHLGQRVPALAAAPLLAQTLPDNASQAASYDAIDTYIEQQLDRLNVPGAAVAIVEGDQIVHQHGFGRARPGGPLPSPQAPFFVGSVTKSFTALAVMQLVEAGKVELDAPVQRYLPWFRVADPQASAQMTVRQLLNQTSGLSTAAGWAPLSDLNQSPGAGERQARALVTLQLTRPVGSAYEYSNMNYNLLGLIVEAASGESYTAYVQDHIFRPLDMRHSYTTPTEARPNGLAVGHRYWFGYPIADYADEQVPRGSLPSGQLISSTEDMSHYLIAQLNDGRYGSAQILSPADIAEMHRPAAEFTMMGVSGQYGMGWFIDGQDQTRIVWHDGVVPDFFAYMAILPGQNKGLVLLMNADHFLMSNTALLEVGTGTARMLAGLQPESIWGGIIPGVLRGLLVIPALQIVGVATTLRRLRRWQRDPHSRPSRLRMWVLHLLLPAIPNLLLATTPILLFGSGLAGFLFIFGPDFSWIALICGSFAGIWMFVRTGLILGALRKEQRPKEERPIVVPQVVAR
jgi:CubicO group peptidase (beta-lactamase class C family)